MPEIDQRVQALGLRGDHAQRVLIAPGKVPFPRASHLQRLCVSNHGRERRLELVCRDGQQVITRA